MAESTHLIGHAAAAMAAAIMTLDGFEHILSTPFARCRPSDLLARALTGGAMALSVLSLAFGIRMMGNVVSRSLE